MANGEGRHTPGIGLESHAHASRHRAMAELTSVRETLKSLASRTEALRGYL